METGQSFPLQLRAWRARRGLSQLELALRAYNGNQVKTAQMLGINRNTLKKKIDNYKIRVKKLN